MRLSIRYFTPALVICCFAIASCKAPAPEKEPAAAPVEKKIEAPAPPAKPLPEGVPAGATEVTPSGGVGTLTLPGPDAPAGGETHSRHDWQLPPGMRGVYVVASHDDLTWEKVNFSIGTGLCPHRGVKLAETDAADGKAVVRFEEEGLSAERDPHWFIHIDADKNLMTKAGKTLSYTYRIFTY